MARPWILRLFLDDLPIKALSLVLAVTLFVIVRSDKDAATGAFVKVIYTLPTDRVLVSDPASQVKIGVRGPWTRLERFSEQEVQPIRVDLTRHAGGELRFNEDMVKLPMGVRVVSFGPPEVPIRFEPRSIRNLPVEPLVEGPPASGFQVVKVVARPDLVRVDGARSMVERLSRVPTRPLRIVGARGPVHGEVALEPPPAHVQFTDVNTIEVEADIEPTPTPGASKPEAN